METKTEIKIKSCKDCLLLSYFPTVYDDPYCRHPKAPEWMRKKDSLWDYTHEKNDVIRPDDCQLKDHQVTILYGY